MSDKENTDIIIYSLIIILILFLILYLLYFGAILYYLQYNHNRNLTVLWIDFFITVATGIVFTIIYLITLLKNQSNRKKYFMEYNSSELFILSKVFLNFSFYAIINNCVFDIIKGFEISYKFIKLKKINTQNEQKLIKELKEIDIMNICKPNNHYNFVIIINLISVILLIFFVLVYTNFISLNNYNVILLQIYYTLVLFGFFITLIVINYLKKKILNNNYYIRDKFAYNLFNINSNQLIHYSDILINKMSIDLFSNISLLVYITFHRFNIFSIIVHEFILYIYIFIGSNFLFSIDKNNKYNKTKTRLNILRILFCSDYFHFHFIKNSFYSYINENEYFFNCSSEEKKILKQFNINFIEDNRNYNNENNEDSHLTDIYYSDAEIREDGSGVVDEGSTNFDMISEFYVLYKLLYIYFDRNKDLYSRFLKKVKKSGGSLLRQYSIESNSSDRKSIKKKMKKQKDGDNNFNKGECMINIERMSGMSEIESKNLILSIKLKKNDIFTIQDKELLEELIQKYKKPKKYKPEFTIEALSHSPLFEIFPLYQMKIEDILKSLQPSNNIKLFKRFLEKLKQSNNSESQKSVNNEKEDEKSINIEFEKDNNNYNNESESESKSSDSNISNCYTYNNLLMIEVYNKSDFINYKQITKLTSSFKNYALKQVKNMKNTFLPLLLGIYNIKFFGLNKIVIMYKNPLYFTNYSSFNNWINFYITETQEKTKKSLMTKDNIIDLNEIEIKDNVKINDNDYEEIKLTLKNDLDYLNNCNFQVFPILHLFVGNEINTEEKLKKSHFMSESFDFGSQGSQQQNNFSVLLNSSSDQFSFSNSIKKKDLSILEYNSLLEKEYYTMNDNKDIYTIKIFLTNYFRFSNKANKEEDKIFLLTPEVYCESLQKQLFTHLKKNISFSKDEKDSNNENNKNIQIELKTSYDERLLIKSGDS